MRDTSHKEACMPLSTIRLFNIEGMEQVLRDAEPGRNHR